MSTAKKPITFYAEEDVQAELDKLPAGVRTAKINELLRNAFGLEKTASDRLVALEKKVKSIEKQLKD